MSVSQESRYVCSSVSVRRLPRDHTAYPAFRMLHVVDVSRYDVYVRMHDSLSRSGADVYPDVVAVWTVLPVKCPPNSVEKHEEILPLLLDQIEERDNVSLWDQQNVPPTHWITVKFRNDASLL